MRRQDMTEAQKADSVMLRVKARVDSIEPDECWLWQGAKYNGTTPMMYNTLNGRVETAKRAIAKAMHVLHNKALPHRNWRPVMSCKETACVNPAHTMWRPYATFMQYVAETTRYGESVERSRRMSERRKERCPLTPEQIEAIRADPRPSEQVGPDYGVHPATIRRHRSGLLVRDKRSHLWAALLPKSR